MRKKILLTGSTGMLGTAIAREWASKYDLSHLGGREDFNFLSGDYDLLGKKYNPQVIVHTAALTNMEYCETHENETMRVNGESVKKLIEVFPNARMIFISSDAVYPLNTKMAKEKTVPNPSTVYGRAKVLGESFVTASRNAVAIRTTIVGRNKSKPGHSLVEWIVDSLTKNQEITLFDDVWFSPISIWHLADALTWIIEHETPKILNIGGSERVSKYQFGYQLAEALELPVNMIKQGKFSELNSSPKRSNEMSLDSSLFRKLSGRALPDLSEVVKMITKHYNKGAL